MKIKIKIKIDNIFLKHINRKPNENEYKKFIKLFNKKGKTGIINELKFNNDFNIIKKTNFDGKQFKEFLEENFIKKLNRKPNNDEYDFFKKNFDKNKNKNFILNKLDEEKERINEENRLNKINTKIILYKSINGVMDL